MDSIAGGIVDPGDWQPSFCCIRKKNMGIIRVPIAVTLLGCAAFCQIPAQPIAELRFAIHADPKTFDPLLAEEEVSETVRYLTGGVLIRVNRQTQRLEPELASSWKVLDHARRIDFLLRPNVKFSDGSPFGPADVVAVFHRIMDPELHSAIADTFRTSGGEIKARVSGPNEVSVVFSRPVAGLEMLFDQLAISSDRVSAVLGPFVVGEHKSGQYVLLRRNPHYWKVDSGGKPLPHLDSIRLEIQASREGEMLRFRRGELHLVDKVEPETFQRLSREMPAAVRNAGPSLDSELLWFNQKPDAPLPPYKRQWFESKRFRQAISLAVNRADLIRLVYRGYAHPAAGPVSPANRFWFNSKLTVPKYDPLAAKKLLEADGFQLNGGVLRDRGGNVVEFSLITNAGNKSREQMGSLIQQDLAKLGIRLNFLPLEFQSLIERITRSQQYEACLLGFNNVELDPNSQMNIWMSSGTLHAWNPLQTKPGTVWEGEIDRYMEEQHSAVEIGSRKRAFDQVQEIAIEQQPIIYLLHPDVLLAASPLVRNLQPSPLPPHLYWNIEYLSLVSPERRSN
jgi:peptide/nickel transport system substrate-binding protein